MAVEQLIYVMAIVPSHAFICKILNWRQMQGMSTMMAEFLDQGRKECNVKYRQQQ